jgi:mannose-6-phosphate isomerase-like protein (cupin superfamily)
VSGDEDMIDPFLSELAEAGVSKAEAMDILTFALGPAPLPDGLRARILASVAAEPRFAAFAEQVAKLVDVTVERARRLIAAIDDPSSWGPSAVPLMQLYNFDGGPRVANAITGFIRMPPDSTFPLHEHVGDEVVLVLRGSFRDSRGQTVGQGEIATSPAGSAHAFTVESGPELLYLVVVQGGVRLGGETYGPDDPRL